MDKNKTFIIAEAGVNHNGSLEMAKELVNYAVEAGVDAVKFQTFKSEKVISRFAEKAEYQKQTTGSSETQLEMVKKLELNAEQHMELIAHCKEAGIQFLSTPFDLDSVDLLAHNLRLPILKVPSGEITNAPYLLKVAQTGLPLIVSTGMATLGEIEQALTVIAFGYTKRAEKPSSKHDLLVAYLSLEGQQVLKENVTLLQCTTEYPAPFEDVNLKAMDSLRQAFGLSVGFSDHTVGIAVPIAAVARGASVIEKHFTLDRSLPGPDHKASLEPDELKEMVTSIRIVESALGSPYKLPARSEWKNISIARKSIVAARQIKKGELFTEQNLTTKRPGTGVSPMYYWDILGKVSSKDYEEDEVIKDYACEQ